MEDMELNKLNVPGIIRFSIKADDTEKNNQIHSDFKNYAALNHNNNYTLALDALLQAVKVDWKFDILWQEVSRLREEVAIAQQKPKEDKEEGVF